MKIDWKEKHKELQDDMYYLIQKHNKYYSKHLIQVSFNKILKNEKTKS